MGIETLAIRLIFCIALTQPTRYMGIETFDVYQLAQGTGTQPTRYMGIETVENMEGQKNPMDTTYSLYGY